MTSSSDTGNFDLEKYKRFEGVKTYSSGNVIALSLSVCLSVCLYLSVSLSSCLSLSLSLSLSLFLSLSLSQSYKFSCGMPYACFQFVVIADHSYPFYFIGTFSFLAISFELRRQVNFYLLSWYIPASLIVILSWVGFWIDLKSTPARVSLSIITILAMAGFLIGNKQGFPHVSYIRAIDTYLITCFVFVFGALVEYAIVHYVSQEHSEKDPTNPRQESNDNVSLFQLANVLVCSSR